MSVPHISNNRCSVVMRHDRVYLLVVVPKSKPAAPPPLEDLMFFGNEPPKPVQPEPDTSASDTYLPGKHWEHGHQVLALEVTPNGEIRRSSAFPKAEFSSLKEVYETCGPFQAISEFATLFGAVLLDKLYILVASKVHCAVKLPKDACIWKVDETHWIPFDLDGVAALQISNSDRNRLNEFQEYSYYKGYYYSDYVDLRQLFPFSLRNQEDFTATFNCDWSKFLRQPFKAASLKFACSMLVRGFCEEKVLAVGSDELHMVLLGRQCTVNPGPRYLGRGLNEANGAGNDHVYEYFMWKSHGVDTLAFTRHVFLRGTIPVRWKSQGSSFSEPVMIFDPNDAEVLRGSDQYFLNVFENLKRTIRTDSNNQSERNPQLRCISLLRLNSQHGEDVLAKKYHSAVRMSEPVVKEMYRDGTLDLVHVDWLNLIKEYGIDVAVNTFWECALGFLAVPTSVDDSVMSVGMIRGNGAVDRLASQTRFVRINCADSLDRTNLGCFFTCLQISIAMLMTLQIRFDAFKDKMAILPLQYIEDGEYGSNISGPVAGAKERVPKPFLSTWNDACNEKKIPAAIVRALAEIFVHNGDCVAMLYTSSAAMHGNILRGVAGMKMGSHNAVIATQRKYENTFEDGKKFRSIEVLLGRNLEIHYPSFSQVYLTRPVPYKLWGTAIVILNVPAECTMEEVDQSIRGAWDSSVVPTLIKNNMAPIESSALCVTITLQRRNTRDSEIAKAAEANVPSASPAVRGVSQFPQDRSGGVLAVVEFDENLCSAVNAPLLLRQQGCLVIRGNKCVMSPYTYEINYNGDTGGSGGMVHSLKKGFKSFMRNL